MVHVIFQGFVAGAQMNIVPFKRGFLKSTTKKTRKHQLKMMVPMVFQLTCPSYPGWCFQIFIIFTPIPGEMIQFDEHIVSDGMVQPPTSYLTWFIIENPIKMDDFGGTTIFGNIHVHHIYHIHPCCVQPVLRLSRHGTDLLIFTSGAFLLPAHRSGRRGLNWFSAKPWTTGEMRGEYEGSSCGYIKWSSTLQGTRIF